VAPSVPDPYEQAQALAAVAGALAKAGQREQAAAVASQAATVARSITDPYEQAQALAAAEALAEADQRELAALAASQAETVARSITNPDRQAQALTAVAKALVAKGDTRWAHHVASAACAVGQWTTVLDVVLSLEPSAVRVFTDL
jgi:hypothetical protein